MAKRILTILPAGTFLMLEYGSYSDRGWNGPFRLLKDLDQKAASEAFEIEAKAEAEYEYEVASSGDFAAWLAKHGYIEDLPSTYIWYVGDYQFDPF